MRSVAIVIGTVALGIIWASMWRLMWLRKAARLADASIKRARPIAGMTHMDEAVRDQSSRRRRERDQVIARLNREFPVGRPRFLHRVG